MSEARDDHPALRLATCPSTAVLGLFTTKWLPHHNRLVVVATKLVMFGLPVVLPAWADAQPVSGLYVSLGVGLDLMQNVIIDASPITGFEQERSESLYPGFAGQGSVGYGFGNGLLAELEGDYLDNVVRGQPILGTTGIRAGGAEEKYGGFANVLYDLDLGLPVVPTSDLAPASNNWSIAGSTPARSASTPRSARSRSRRRLEASPIRALPDLPYR